MAIKNIDVSMIPYMPLKAHWLESLAAYHSSNAAIVRACMAMLQHAWHACPAGSIACDEQSLAAITGLDVSVVQTNRNLLLSGWTLSKTRNSGEMATFSPLAEMAAGLHEGYRDALQRLQQACVVAIAAPDLFGSELLPTQGGSLLSEVGDATREIVPARSKVKRRLPDNAPLNRYCRDVLFRMGFSEETHDAIWQRFTGFHIAEGKTSESWDLHFRHWMENRVRYGDLTPDMAGVKPTVTAQPVATARAMPRFAVAARVGAPTRGEQAAANTSASIARAKAAMDKRRAAPPPTAVPIRPHTVNSR